MTSGELWAITCYYNPVGFQRRRQNYTAFRRAISAPLLTVELAIGRDFELDKSDATSLIQLRTEHVLWHKERLLNLAVAALPASCTKVAWLDCDVLFASHDWALEATQALDRFALIQPYGTVCDLSSDADITDLSLAKPTMVRESLASRVLAKALNLGGPGAGPATFCSPGHAWAARRDILRRIGLYDAMILGGADSLMACAAMGLSDGMPRASGMNEAQARHYLRWAHAFHEAVGENIGAIPGRLYHLWHGHLLDRQYDTRYRGLTPFAFDPAHDISLDPNGVWQWSTDKRGLVEYVRRYFESRFEDGRP